MHSSVPNSNKLKQQRISEGNLGGCHYDVRVGKDVLNKKQNH
jgi:hypothetical protein